MFVTEKDHDSSPQASPLSNHISIDVENLNTTLFFLMVTESLTSHGGSLLFSPQNDSCLPFLKKHAAVL